MTNFSKRLRMEIDYIGLNQKEFAAKVGIKKRALDAYLGLQQSIPPADVAAKMASVLGLSVEYLITGKEYRATVDISNYLRFKDILDDFQILPDEIIDIIKVMIRAAADKERKKAKLN